MLKKGLSPIVRIFRSIRDQELVGPMIAVAVCSFYMILCFSAPLPFRSRGTASVDGQETLPTPTVSSAADSLETLDWLVGDWRLTSETTEMKWKAAYAANRKFLVIQEELRLIGSGERFGALRIIAHDPVSQLFNVSIFGSDGSFGTGILSRGDDFGAPVDVGNGLTADNEWILTGRVLLPDARAATMTEIFYPLTGGGFQWKSISRAVADAPLPNIGPLTAEAVPPLTFDVHVLTAPLPAILEADE